MSNQNHRTVYGEQSLRPDPTQKVPVADGQDPYPYARKNLPEPSQGYYVNNTCNNMNSQYPERQEQPPLGQTRVPEQAVFGNPEQFKKMPIYGGNWSRGKYDRGALEVDTRQATSTLEYRLDPIYAERCNICRAPGPGWIGKQGVSYDTNTPIVDTESELFNLTRVQSNDPNFKYLPYCPNCGECTEGIPCGSGVVKGCHKCQPKLFHFPACDLKFEYTRISNPTCTLRETGKNRFQPICLNPQDPQRWEHPGEVGINYRMIAKDNHVPCIPYPLDPAPALPRGGDVPCELITPTCSAHITPMHNYYNRQRY
jgi:hypothetical protein